MAVGTEIDRARIRVNDLDLALDGHPYPVRTRKDAAGLRCDLRHVAFGEVDEAFRFTRNRHGVRGGKVFVLAETDDEGRALTSRHHRPRVPGRDDSDTVAAAQFGNRLFDCLKKRPVVVAVHEVSNYLGIRLARELVTLRSEPRAKFFVILDDPVVHDADRTVGEMGMSVHHFRRAVRRPTRV